MQPAPEPPAPAPPRLLLLGPVAWQDARGLQPLPAERGVQLLAWLGQRGQWTARAEAAALLWPEADAAAARRNLRKVLHRMARWAQALPAVEQRGQQMRWVVDTDVLAFERALQAQELATALALWRGPPWSGIAAELQGALGDWVHNERLRLCGLWRDASLQHARSAAPPQRAALARALLQADPFDEEALVLLLQALVADGRRQEAQQAYAGFEQRLWQQFGLHPAVATWQCLQPPSAAAAAPPAQAAPMAATELVGRRAERQAVLARLAEPGCRWLTLTGLGGVGKTRLARALHADWAASQPGGATWVALDRVATDAAAFDRVAEALGLPPSREPLATLAGHLAGRQRLLVLDNLEHLAPAAQALAAALGGCAGVRVLATSRARLGAAGEVLYPLAGLPWPSAEDQADALRFDAVRLFLACEQGHRAAHRGAPALQAVARLCAAVEGVPLALELAAAWTRHLGIDEIADELARGQLGLLATPGDGGAAGAEHAPRHASAQASFEHSWRLMTGAEQRLLARLSVFRGGFTRAAALAVGDAALPVLAGLLDKSMVRRDDEANARFTRYSLHPLVQQFAAERLAALPAEQAQAQQRLTAHFCRVLTELPTMARPPQRVLAARALAPDLDNLAQAWRLGVAAGAVALLRPCITTLRAVHLLLGRWNDGEALLDATEPLVAGDDTALGEVAAGRTAIAMFRGDYAGAVAHGRRACRLLRRRGDAALRSEVLGNMTYSLLQGGHLAAARRCNLQGLALAREADVAITVAGHLTTLAGIEHQGGDFDAGARHAREAVALRRAIGSSPAAPLSSLIDCLLGAERHAEALAANDEALQDCDNDPAPNARCHLLVQRVRALLPLGRLAEARDAAAAAQALLPGNEAGPLRAMAGLAQARVALAEGDGPAAWRCLAQVVACSLAGDQRLIQVEALLGFSEALAAAGRPQHAVALLRQALAQPANTAAGRQRALHLLQALGSGPAEPPAPLPDAGLADLLLQLAAAPP